jgi:hypothetical protein
MIGAAAEGATMDVLALAAVYILSYQSMTTVSSQTE